MGSPETTDIVYRFYLGQETKDIKLTFGLKNFDLRSQESQPPPDWTKLDWCKCPNCPLTSGSTITCPFAYALSPVITAFDDFYSYEKAVVEVVTAERTIVTHTTLQRGMASAMGLISATSGCPHTAFFRPMARFHLPFAGTEETLYRAFSMYLLSEYFRGGGQIIDDVKLTGLREKYAATQIVNSTMAMRIRTAFSKDVAVNAVIILDSFAEAVPFVIDERLEELRYVFDYDAPG